MTRKDIENINMVITIIKENQDRSYNKLNRKRKMTPKDIENINMMITIIEESQDRSYNLLMETNEANQRECPHKNCIRDKQDKHCAKIDPGHVLQTDEEDYFPTDRTFIPSGDSEEPDKEKRRIISEALAKDTLLSRFSEEERRYIVDKLEKIIFKKCRSKIF